MYTGRVGAAQTQQAMKLEVEVEISMKLEIKNL